VLTLPRHYNRPHAEKDILDGLHAARAGGRFLTSFLVGLRRYHPYPFRRMVGRLPQRLVLGDKGSMRAMSVLDSLSLHWAASEEYEHVNLKFGGRYSVCPYSSWQ
jgi:hypothetical protein